MMPVSTPSADLRLAERTAIEKALRDMDGNKSKTARRLGLSRTQLYVRRRRYDLVPPPVES
jgi:DNA-binding NtrC family response regulator